MAELTREFFDRPENDDTLQNIRRQYLDSKRNLQDLMTKQSEDDTKIRKEFLSPLKAPKPEGKLVGSENLMMMNEIRSLRSLIYEQQAQIRRLQADLQSRKSAEFELQRGFVQLQSQVQVLEAEVATMRTNLRGASLPLVPAAHHSDYRGVLNSSTADDNTTRLIRISGPR